ncbi:tetratricopeptide repeat protein 37-like [Homarus americanus]|uniref:tetratricopeptide repeat protein 37-like n=1 Tax=Homarus americanus TaxID=6706 RepID=UPI001C44D4A6|nr:tetratricopeptide repeat protein 37-like [Homarus americanus]
MSVMNEVKFALRDAKKAMKENDFEAVAKHCKTALKYDRKNYNALLLFGRACQELGKLEDSKKALMMATQVDSESPVAWQGLAMLCEKQPNISTLDETITIYIRLTHIIKDDDDKVDNVYRKLAALQLKNDEPLKAAATLKLLTTKLKDHKRVQEVWRSIAQTLSGIKDLPDEHASELQEALENVLNESVLGDNEGNYQRYIRLLYQTRQLVKLVEAARTMAEIFPTYYPLEWICRMYVLMTTNPQEDEEGYPLSSEEARTYITKLLRLNRASPWGNLAQGLVYKGEGLYIEAKAHLRVGAERVGNNLLPWKILLEIQEATNDWPGVEVSCKKSLKIMEADETITIPDDEGFEAYRTKMMLTQAKAYVIMGHKNHLRQAVDILEEHAYTSLDCGLLLVRSRIKLLEFDQTEDELLKLEEAFGEHSQLKLLRGCLLRAQGERQKAMQVLEEFVEEEPKSAEGHLELGCVYFATGELQKAQMSCMRAGKLNPKLGGPFLYLGHFYRRQDNMEKAVKCYEKALSLDPCDDQTGAALSDLYRILGKYEANINLLHRITNEGGRASCCWAWLRLGLHHLALQNYDQAIQAFQCTLKINPDDSATFECLGDAYLARGAHSAALKAFNYASLLNPGALYPLYQIAHIKQIVGETLDAVKDYETVLKREPIKPVQVVSLIGLAEALIAAARKHYEQFFHANVKDACLRALVCLIRAASIKPESACIWKLIGDACTLLYPMPTSLSNFSIPAKLIQKDVEDLEEMTEVDKMQILQIGARCYGVALQVTKDDAMLWHDLGVNTYLQGKVLEEGVDGRNDVNTRDLMDRSVMALRKSLSLDPLNGKTWNSLGIVAAHNLVGQYALAQHALIRACEYQPNAVVWTHLGAFYLTHSEHSLAHEAFSQAQALDPSFVTCWVGQALVAEKVGHSEVFDLFRHTTLLGIQVESCVGYSHHVTNLASDSKKNTNQRTQYTIKQSLPAATDASTFYSREKEEDVIGLNMNGLTLEMMGLYQSAAKAYEMAMAAIDPDQPEMQDCLDGVRCNLGRTLTAQGKVEEAMKQFKAIKSPDYFTQCGLALASLKAGQFEDAYNGYTAALHWLAPDDTQKSHILVALASLQYKFQKSDEAKNLLFQGSQLSGASVRGLLALAALGLISGDAVLTSAALAELAPYEHHKDYLHHVAFIKAAEATARGNTKEAKSILSRTIHQHPSSAPLWRSLARHLLTTTTSTSKKISGQCSAAAMCAAAATKLSQAAGEHKTITQDAVTSVMATLGLEVSIQRNSKNKTSLKQAQRAVLMCPGSPEAWAMLVAAQIVAGHGQTDTHLAPLAKILSQKGSPQISSWLQTISTRLA